MLGFIIIRHVNSKITDYFWKECYTCIRTYYDNPIMIIDDSSNEYLNENIILTNCTVIYDREHKGAGELLPYYYFHILKPFEKAVIIHDSVFIQSKIDFDTENITFLWSFGHQYDSSISHLIPDLCNNLLHPQEIIDLYNQPSLWKGCFGVMSVITWDFLELMNKKHNIIGLLSHIKNRANRCTLERVFAVIAYNTAPIKNIPIFGDIHSYIKWGITFMEYVMNDYRQYPIMKIWSDR